jgi:3-methyladenine DNA glycosylase AlkD
MASVEVMVDRLKKLSRPDQLEGMARYGMAVERRLGVAIPDLRRMAKELGTDHRLALGLWRTGIAEARILASMIAHPSRLTETRMEKWVKEFDSWDVCDQVCMNLFEKTPFAWKKINQWSRREEEFVKRAAFALLACLAWHDKAAGDDLFIKALPSIREGAADNRNYVKKAVQWALRNIGKRNAGLNLAAIRAAREIQRIDSPSARWVANGALKELRSEAVRQRLTGARKST